MQIEGKSTLKQMTWKAQKAIIANKHIGDHKKLIDLIMGNRVRLWEQGGIEAIKRGAYYASYRYVDVADNPDESYFDKIVISKDRTYATGWTRGLENNIAFRIKGGPYMLVMDNHNLAAPFLMEMLNRKAISFNNRFIHVDRHADLGKTDEFRFVEYLWAKTEREKLLYVLQKTTVGAWSEPLFSSSIVPRGNYDWIMLSDNTGTWTRNTLGEKEPIILQENQTLNEYESLKGVEIVDIDIDFLENMDFMLSKKEKKDVLSGTIPANIALKLSELVPFILGSKVTTIALSPCYIEQNRALMYVKYLLQMAGELRGF